MQFLYFKNKIWKCRLQNGGIIVSAKCINTLLSRQVTSILQTTFEGQLIELGEIWIQIQRLYLKMMYIIH